MSFCVSLTIHYRDRAFSLTKALGLGYRRVYVVLRRTSRRRSTYGRSSRHYYDCQAYSIVLSYLLGGVYYRYYGYASLYVSYYYSCGVVVRILFSSSFLSVRRLCPVCFPSSLTAV